MSKALRELKLTQKDATEMLATCRHPKATLPGVNWSCFITLMINDTALTKIQKVIDAASDDGNIAETFPAAKQKALQEKYREYEVKRLELCKKHAERKHGAPVMFGPNTFQMKDIEGFEKDHNKLVERYQQAVNARAAQTEKVNKLLDKEVTLKLPVIKQSDLPKEISPDITGPLHRLLLYGE